MTHPIARIDAAAAGALLPERPTDGHKGTFGTVLAVCGSPDYAGAALLAGAAALRTGCGLVALALPRTLRAELAGRVPELVTLGLPESAPYTADPVAALALLAGRRADALVAGCGLAPGPATAALVRGLVAGEGPAGIPAVLDAEALGVLAATPGWTATVRRPLVLTPHPGELARLDGQPPDADDAARRTRALALAAASRSIVVLKGARTVVAAPDGRCAVADAANPALATAGTGDILAGVIASLLAQGLAPRDAAIAGVHLHAAAGAAVAARTGDAGLLASDLLPELPRVRRALVLGRDRRPIGFGAEARAAGEPA